ncbi:serine/threonine protein kinase [Blastococcus sp. CT_GayMR19]|uniref:serine/threonine-protein kinase n=1 Tax=Blastococcus sp. CT_GayMR19 TaxID=2559608 RepID=UPI0010735B73|nr:serine/threonine-protein kinase [Blastococcus sp. CT_GayMR19]TFV79165.1 serine/threonine protein kinase [Blastococcus sp. CT_GayMR19]
MSVAVPLGEPAPDEPPVVPGYTLEELLGRGGSGEVWRAVPRRGGTPVAVKVLVAGDPERQGREAALLGELDHPHLVRLLEVVHQPRRGGAPRVVLVLELLAGGSLAALLARRGRLRPGEVVTAIAPVAAALAHAHENGVVHGDLSPGNIVFTAEGRPVLTDLGVARVLGEAAAGEVTPAYVDPTVARGGAPGAASDVFGVAAAAFHALTGIAPWNAATPGDTLEVAATGLLPDLTELAPGAPPALLEVIARGLAPDPHHRGSAAAFALDLRHACRPDPVRLPMVGVPDAELGRTGRGPRTELTHQVPGRRPRTRPAVVPPAGERGMRWARVREWLRRGTGRAVAGALVLAAMTGAVWLGLRWTDTAETAGRGGASLAAATSAAPTAATRTGEAPAGSAPTGGPTAGTGLADRQEAPGTPAAWQLLVEELYGRRAQCFGAGTPELLGGVYAPGSPLRAADEAHVRALAAAGETLRGFAPAVVEVTGVSVTDDRALLDLVDRRPEYEVVAAGSGEAPALRTEPGRPQTAVRMALLRTPEGWRIESAERVG